MSRTILRYAEYWAEGDAVLSNKLTVNVDGNRIKMVILYQLNGMQIGWKIRNVKEDMNEDARMST